MFINEKFLLNSDLALELYNEVKDLPIIDFHNHLDPKEIFENIPYTDISNIWLDFDHYKWRLMRNSGIDEAFITGDESELSKFNSYTSALENAYMNPLYHWTHMELKQYFNITEVLTSENSKDIYEKVNEQLKSNPRGPRDFLAEMKVETLCTTDDLLSDLKYHKLIKDDRKIKINVLPTFRPDRLFSQDDSVFQDVIKGLEKATKITISGISTLMKALSSRLDFFQENGCVFSDHGLTELNYHVITKEDASAIIKRRLLKKKVTKKEVEAFNVYLLKFFLIEYGRRNMVTQLHIGALRNMNISMFNKLGKDAGFDSISDYNYIEDINSLLSEVGNHFELPEMIIFNLNSKDNEALASVCGNFSKGKPGNIQLGAPWWFNDNFSSIEKQLVVYSEYLNISTFKGMLTDSRSYLSFVRHDYFRRILCNFIAEKVLLGNIPHNSGVLKKLLVDISYKNIQKVFK